VAHRVADVVLEEGNLETLIVAVSQGRTIYNNIRKALHFLLATNLSEIELMLGSMALGMGQPLNAMQLLWINLLTDVFPAIALSAEPTEPDILQRPPRDPDMPIIQRADFRRYGRESLLMTASALFAFGYGRMRYGPGTQASTLAFHTLVSAQLLHAIVCRSDTHGIFNRDHRPPNRYLQAAIGGSFALQALAGFVPPLRGLLGISPLGLTDLAIVGAGAFAPLMLNEMAKLGPSPVAAWPRRPEGTAVSSGQKASAPHEAVTIVH
jgi:Ca2+-transporting ATPase